MTTHPTSTVRRSTDLVIVGAGPTGLFAAYYAGFRGLSTIIVDSLDEPGGQIAAMYPEKNIFDIAGFPSVRGRDLVNRLVEQADQFHPEYLLGQRADALSHTDDGVTVSTDKGVQIDAGAVLVTGGIGTFTPRSLPALDEWHGRGVHYFVPRLDDLSGHDVVILGGGDSAFDWAVALQPHARSLTLVHRRDQFRAHEATVNAVLASDVDVATPYEVAELRGNGAVTEVVITHKQDQTVRMVPAQAVVAALGFIADLGPLESWGMELSQRSILVDTAMRTNLPRVFAAGDITEYPGKVKLMAVGFGEAATAVNNVTPLLREGSKVFPGHSTDSSHAV